MLLTETLATWNGEQGLDTVEPVGQDAGAFQAIVGTYKLQEGGTRIGGVHLINADISSAKLESAAFVSLPAVLDSRVCGGPNGLALAACADGSLRCFSLPELQPKWTWNSGGMLLSLSVVREARDGNLVALSDSSGRIFLVKMTRAGCTLVHEIAVHAAEAWTVDAGDESVLYSGGDDAYLHATDVRTKGTAWKKRAHGDVGVTSIVCRGEYNLWTGGYDDCMKIWDTRSIRIPLAEKDLGGGVWRIKFHPDRSDFVLAACMYDGFKIVRVDRDFSLITHAHYTGHQSISYGAAWVKDSGPLPKERFVALTASFYDQSLQLWSARHS